MNNGWLWPLNYIQELNLAFISLIILYILFIIHFHKSICALWCCEIISAVPVIVQSSKTQREDCKLCTGMNSPSEFISSSLYVHKRSGGVLESGSQVFERQIWHFNTFRHFTHTCTCTHILICSQGQQLDPFPFQELAVASETHVAFAYVCVNMHSQWNAGKFYLQSEWTVA